MELIFSATVLVVITFLLIGTIFYSLLLCCGASKMMIEQYIKDMTDPDNDLPRIPAMKNIKTVKVEQYSACLDGLFGSIEVKTMESLYGRNNLRSSEKYFDKPPIETRYGESTPVPWCYLDEQPEIDDKFSSMKCRLK